MVEVNTERLEEKETELSLVSGVWEQRAEVSIVDVTQNLPEEKQASSQPCFQF